MMWEVNFGYWYRTKNPDIQVQVPEENASDFGTQNQQAHEVALVSPQEDL